MNDEGPLLTTRKRLADDLDAIAGTLSKATLRLRSCGVYLGPDQLRGLYDLPWQAAVYVTDLAAQVRVGAVPLLYQDQTPTDPLPLFPEAESGHKPESTTTADLPLFEPDLDPGAGAGVRNGLAADREALDAPQPERVPIEAGGGCDSVLDPGDPAAAAKPAKRPRRNRRSDGPALAQDHEAAVALPRESSDEPALENEAGSAPTALGIEGAESAAVIEYDLEALFAAESDEDDSSRVLAYAADIRQQQSQLDRVLSEAIDSDHARWSVLIMNGAGDGEIKRAHLWGTGQVVSRRGRHGIYSYRGGNRPSFWFGWHRGESTGQNPTPTMSGSNLFQAIRRLLGIPEPLPSPWKSRTKRPPKNHTSATP